MLRAIVTADLFGLTSPFSDLFECSLHTFSGKEKICLNAQPFPVKVVYNIQEPNAAAILQLVVHEIHRPDPVYGIRHGKGFRLLTL